MTWTPSTQQAVKEALMAVRKVLRHKSKDKTVQIRGDKNIQVSTNRALQAAHELKKTEEALELIRQEEENEKR